jgi:sensor c-di-GMP phosphodiesterase-like protein
MTMSNSTPPVPPLTMHYQPIVSLTTGVVTGCEALLRLLGPDGEPHSPAGEIEHLESSEAAANALTEAVFCCVDRDFVPVLRAHPDLYVSVNIPPLVLGNGRAAAVIRGLDLVNHLPQMVVEITERQALTEPGRRALRLARETGMRVAVDDFGTGDSGLAQIMGLEFDILKIDRSHIAPLFRSLPAERLLRGVVALAGALRVAVVAEGIEKPEQALFLRAAGVDYGQGWYWSPAVPAAEFAEIVTRGCSVPSGAF